MIRALYIAKTGMDSSQFKLDVVSNNLANVNTKGFKRSNAVFEDLYYQTLRQPGAQLSNGNVLPTGLHVGTGAAPVATARVHTQGDMIRTEQTLDMAIAGDGFFRIQQTDGTIAYTRNGEFKRNNNGLVVNADGLALDPAITIPATATKITVSPQGLLEYYESGSGVAAGSFQINTSTFINPQGLESIGGNLYLATGASGDPVDGVPGSDGRGLVSQGFLEGSNVNVTEELINMIQAQRAYEINSRAIKTADEMLQKLTQL